MTETYYVGLNSRGPDCLLKENPLGNQVRNDDVKDRIPNQIKQYKGGYELPAELSDFSPAFGEFQKPPAFFVLSCF